MSEFCKNFISREIKFMCRVRGKKAGGIYSHHAFLYTHRILCFTENFNSILLITDEVTKTKMAS